MRNLLLILSIYNIYLRSWLVRLVCKQNNLHIMIAFTQITFVEMNKAPRIDYIYSSAPFTRKGFQDVSTLIKKTDFDRNLSLFQEIKKNMRAMNINSKPLVFRNIRDNETEITVGERERWRYKPAPNSTIESLAPRPIDL